MRPVNVYAACGVCEGLRFKKGMNSNEFNKRIRRRPLVGVLALTKLVTKGSKRRAVRFVDHIFVLPKWRKRGIGQSLLRNALEVTPPYYTTGADESKASKNQPLVGVVVRKHAKQQAAARSLGAARHKLDGFVIAPKDRAGDAATIIAEGFARTHDRARSVLAKARKDGDDEALHELRKRVKYHWMHLRLIAPLWPDAIAPLTKAAKAIADGLGLDHDYSVMRQEIAATPEAFGAPRELAVLAALIDRRQAELRAAALDTARRLLADDPDGVKTRVKRLYRAGPVRGASDPGAPVASPLEVLRQAE